MFKKKFNELFHRVFSTVLEADDGKTILKEEIGRFERSPVDISFLIAWIYSQDKKRITGRTNGLTVTLIDG